MEDIKILLKEADWAIIQIIDWLDLNDIESSVMSELEKTRNLFTFLKGYVECLRDQQVLKQDSGTGQPKLVQGEY